MLVLIVTGPLRLHEHITVFAAQRDGLVRGKGPRSRRPDDDADLRVSELAARDAGAALDAIPTFMTIRLDKSQLRVPGARGRGARRGIERGFYGPHWFNGGRGANDRGRQNGRESVDASIELGYMIP